MTNLFHLIRWASRLLFLFLSIGSASAQVIYVDYPPIAWEGKRLIELDKPISTKVYRYKSPTLDFGDFKATYPHTEWLPIAMVILPPEEADTVDCAWAFGLIQDTLHGDRLPILMFFTHVGKPNGMTYIDYNFNGNFRDDGPPMVVGNRLDPKAIEMVSINRHGYRFYMAESHAPAVIDDGKHRPMRFSIIAHSAPGKFAYSLDYSEPNKEHEVDFTVGGYAVGAMGKFDYMLKSFTAAAKVGFEFSTYQSPARTRYTERLVCHSNGICSTQTSLSTNYNADTLPTTRFLLGSELGWMPRIVSGLRIGPVASAGVYLYPGGSYRTTLAPGERFPLKPTPYWEGGLQAWLDVSPQLFIVLRGAYSQASFRPKGFFESLAARDVVQSQSSLRIGAGMGWKF